MIIFLSPSIENLPNARPPFPARAHCSEPSEHSTPVYTHYFYSSSSPVKASSYITPRPVFPRLDCHYTSISAAPSSLSLPAPSPTRSPHTHKPLPDPPPLPPTPTATPPSVPSLSVPLPGALHLFRAGPYNLICFPAPERLIAGPARCSAHTYT